MWEKGELVIAVALISLVSLMGILSQQQSAIAQSAKNTAELPSKANQAPEPPKVSPNTSPDANNLSPRISFEKTVCDLGDVGRGTKNTCEFKFTNTGSADGGLKIGKIKRTCGCTVFELDRKEYAPGRTGTIRVSYIAGKATALMQKHIYVPSNDRDNPKVKLTIKARVVQMVEAAPQKLQLSLKKGGAGIPDIRLASKGGKPFSIKGFKSTNNGIAGFFQYLCYGNRFRRDRKLSLGLHFTVVADIGVSAVQAGHQHAPGRRADRAAGIMLREAHPLGRHPVDVWGLNVLLAVAAYVSVAEVVGHDENDVRLL